MHLLRSLRSSLRATAALTAATALTAGLALSPTTAARADEGTDGPAYGAPAVGKCHDYGKRVYWSESDTKPAVPCAQDHTAYTVAVPSLPDGLDYDQPTPEKFYSKVSNQVLPACATALRKALDTNWRTYMKTAYRLAWFVPTEEQIAHGARWIRCDLVLKSGIGSLQDLPARKPALKRITKAERACIVLDSDGSGWETGCNRKHHYKATHNHQIPKSTYPSDKRFNRLAAKHCAGKKYWWAQVGSRAEWRAGNRVLQCYALDV
ncbi:septum formation family protein [Nocardioides sp. YIM 152588]|uniref:septum formation family protein n=1 Tax=Nocardioides sp. YIM 152588 TaxID=3158259 RepID=UPI0032E4AEA6